MAAVKSPSPALVGKFMKKFNLLVVKISRYLARLNHVQQELIVEMLEQKCVFWLLAGLTRLDCTRISDERCFAQML